jgi:hypothetical protein
VAYLTSYPKGTGRALSPGVKLPGREDDQSQTSAEVKNVWVYISTTPSVIIPWYLIKHKDIFILIVFHKAGVLLTFDHLCGLVGRVPGYRSRGPGSIPGTTRFPEKQCVWNGVHSAS